MTKPARTTLSLVISLVLFSAAALARPGVNGADRDKNTDKGHQSRISKLAFWRHHRDSNKKPTIQAKQAQAKQAPVKTAQIKPAPATGKRDQKQRENATSKAAAKKGSATSKTKPREKSAS